MVLFTAAVTAAEEAMVIVAEDSSDETGTVTTDSTVIIAGDVADETTNATQESETVVLVLTPESKQATIAIDHSLMMAAEEAFDYLLTGNAEEKQAFFDEVAAIEDDVATFEENYDLTAENATEVKVLFNEVIAAADAMETTGSTMFASYEAGQTIPEEIAAFEEQVDIVSEKFSKIRDVARGSTTGSRTVESFQLKLIGKLLDAAEETYAYPVIGNVTEKEDALASFTGFDSILAEAQEQYPDVSFEDLKTVKANLLTAAEAIFAAYEADGTVSPDVIAAFEKQLEAFTDTFVVVVPVEVTKEVVVVEEPVTEE
jgi:hypothetical protein